MGTQQSKLEVCVDTFEGLVAAMAGGADRIELCSSLSEGGLTPSAGLIQAAARLGIPCHAMIRPRAGNFMYSENEIEIMLHDISLVQLHGLRGVVFGAETDKGELDLNLICRLKSASAGLETTLHRVIDVVADRFLALDQAVEVGMDRVLSSGGAKNALAGIGEISEMVRHAGERIIVMPGGGITPENVRQIAAATKAREFHASCRSSKTQPPVHMFNEAHSPVTSVRVVQDMKAALSKHDE